VQPARGRVPTLPRCRVEDAATQGCLVHRYAPSRVAAHCAVTLLVLMHLTACVFAAGQRRAPRRCLLAAICQPATRPCPLRCGSAPHSLSDTVLIHVFWGGGRCCAFSISRLGPGSAVPWQQAASTSSDTYQLALMVACTLVFQLLTRLSPRRLAVTHEPHHRAVQWLQWLPRAYLFQLPGDVLSLASSPARARW
jgi:hypothetical protein